MRELSISTLDDFLKVITRVLIPDQIEKQKIANNGTAATTLICSSQYCGVGFVFTYERHGNWNNSYVGSPNWKLFVESHIDYPTTLVTIKGDKAKFRQFLGLVLLLKSSLRT